MNTKKTTKFWLLSVLAFWSVLTMQAQTRSIASDEDIVTPPVLDVQVCNAVFYTDHESDNAKIYAVTPDLASGTAQTTLFFEMPFTDAHISLNPEGTRLYAVSGKGNNELGYVDIATKTYTKVADLKIGKVTQLAFAPTGYLYVTSNTDSKVYVIEDLSNPVLKDYGKIAVGDKFIKIEGADIAFSQAGRFIIATSAEGGRFYEVTGGQGNLKGTELGIKRNTQITGIAFMDNGQGYLMYSSRDKSYFTIIDATTGGEVAKLTMVGGVTKARWGDMSSSCMETIEPPVLEGCTAVEIVEFNQARTRKGNAVPADRSDPYKALGEPQGGDAKDSFVSLGFGGNIVLKFGAAIINGEGADLRVVETSYGNPSCAKYTEQVEVFASKDGVNWVSLGSSCLDSEFELGTLDWAVYVKLVDISDKNDFKGDEDGYDVDGITCIHGTMPIPTPIPPVTCQDIQITQSDLGIITIANSHVKTVVVNYSIAKGNLDEVESGTILVEGKSSVNFSKEIPDNGKVTFLLGSENIFGALTADTYCTVKTGTEVIDAGTRIDTIQVYEGKVYDARSWSWFAPKERQVLRDLEGNTVAETDKGVSLNDLTVLGNETNMKVQAKTGSIGYTHVVGSFIIDANGMPSQPQILINSMKARQTSEGTIEGTIPAGSTFGFFLVAAHERSNPLVQNPDAEVRFKGTVLEYSNDGTTWTAVPNTQIVYTIKAWNRNQKEQAIAGVVDLEDGTQALRVGFEDIAGGGDLDYEDIALTVYLSGVTQLKTKATPITKEVDVYSEIPCGDCQVVIEGKKTPEVPALSCEDVIMNVDGEGTISFTNNATAAVIVSYNETSVEIPAGTTQAIADKAPVGGKLMFTADFKNEVAVEGEEKCAVKIGTQTISADTKVPVLVEINGKVYDARSWEVFDLAERKVVSFTGGVSLDPMDYGVSLSDLTTVTEEANLVVDAKVGGVGSLNFIGIFTIDGSGKPQNPEILYLVNGNKTAQVKQVIPANTLVGFFNISYKDKTLYQEGNHNFIRFKEGTHILEVSTDGTTWKDLSAFDKKIQTQYTIANYNLLDGTEMNIAGVENVNGVNVLKVGFENNYYDDWDYEDIILTVHFSPEMVYETKIVTETKEIDLFAEAPCASCTFEVEGPAAPPVPVITITAPVSCEAISVVADATGTVTVSNASALDAVITYNTTTLTLAAGTSEVLAEKAPEGGQLSVAVSFANIVAIPEQEESCAVSLVENQYTPVPCEACSFVVDGPEPVVVIEEPEEPIVEEPCNYNYDLSVYANSVTSAAVGDIVDYEVVVFSNGELAKDVVLAASFPENVTLLGATDEYGTPFEDASMVALGDMELWSYKIVYYQISIDSAPEGYVPGNIVLDGDFGEGGGSGSFLTATFEVTAGCGTEIFADDNINTWDITLGEAPVVLFDANAPSINVYPNPFVDVLNVQFNNLDQSVISLTLRNNKGEIVYQATEKMNSQFLVTAELGTLPAGNYFLEVRTNNYDETIKVFKFE